MAHDVSKLPKWARDRIQRLVGRVEWLEGRLKEVQGGSGRIVHGTLPDDKLHLPEDSVEFQLLAPEGHWRPERTIAIRMLEVSEQEPEDPRKFFKREVLEVYAAGRLVVTPRSSNVVQVYTDPL